jgi:phospholipid transport system substrate-binding protein
MKKSLSLPLGLLLSVMAWVFPVLAGDAQAYLKVRHTELTTLVSDNAPAQKLTTAFDALLDYETLAKTSLDSEWTKLDAAQKKEFQDLLVILVQRAYTKNIRDTLNYAVEFQGEDALPGGMLVKTVAKHKSDQHREPISINYIVAEQSGKWRVRDIVTEGSSLVSNYRNQFRKIIEKQGYPGLIEKMKKKAAEPS